MSKNRFRFLRLLLCTLFPFAPLEVEEHRCENADVETASERYRTRFKGKTGHWFLQNQNNHLLELLAPWKGASILDIGGGHGQYTQNLLDHGYDVTILGSSPDANAQVHDLVESGQCRYTVSDLRNWQVPDKSYDLVISFRLLTHLQDWHSFVREATRVARHAVIVDFPITRSFNALYPLLFSLKRAFEGETTRPFHVFKESEVLAAFAQKSFLPTARRPQYLFPMVVHRSLHAPSMSRITEKACASAGLTRRFGSPVILRLEQQPQNA